MIVAAWLYVLIDPRGGAIRYVGWTTRTLERRLTEHCCPNDSDKSYRANWIRKLKRLGLRPTIQAINRVSTGAAPEMEVRLIARYRAAGCMLTNTTNGGEGTTGFKHPSGTFDHSRWPEVVAAYRRLKSVRRVAGATRISKTGVAYILNASGEPLFGRARNGAENSCRKSIVAGSPRALVRDFNVMHRLYEVERLSIPAVARALGVSRTTVITGLRQCGIQMRTKSEAARGRPWLLQRRQS